MALKLITPPTSEPLTLNEAKEHLRVEISETAEDNYINSLIKSAREEAEKFQNRAYLFQEWELILDEFPQKMPFPLPRPPLVSVLSMTYKDVDGLSYTFDPTNYVADIDSEPGRIALKRGKTWPTIELFPIGAVRIQFKAGVDVSAKVSERVKTAMKLYIGHRYENRESEDVPEAFYNLLWPNRVVPT